MFEDRFDGHWRLLLRALMSGIHGAHRALDVYHKQHRVNHTKPLEHFIETLCQDGVACPVSGTKPLTVKPMVCLFPALFKQNCLAFILQIYQLLPPSTVRHVLECIKEDLLPNTWITSLIAQLERQLDNNYETPLFGTQCGQRLMDLSQRSSGGKAAGWASCFHATSSPSASESTGSPLLKVSSQRKRKCSAVDQDSDFIEVSQQSKRKRVHFSDSEEGSIELSKRVEPPDASSEATPPPPDVPHGTLPESIKVAVLQLKDLLETDAEWDQSSSDMVKVLNDCDPHQIELVCSTLNLPYVPEHVLPKLCCSILELSPDLSFCTATAFIKSLLLEKVLLLSEPASRCLVTTASSLCSRYPRPMCHALFEPILENKNLGNLQADLLNKLIESSLNSHYKLLILQMTFTIQWTEAVLSIIHCLLDSKLEIKEDVLTNFTEKLMNQAPQFTKSVKFAKMLLSLLTKYSSAVTTAHKHTLSDCLMLNETFLKKSLLATFNRITRL